MPIQIAYSAHAEYQLKERGISKKQVRETIQKAEHVQERRDGTKVAQRRVQWHNRDVLCRVMYRMTNSERVLIITAYVTTKFSKYA